MSAPIQSNVVSLDEILVGDIWSRPARVVDSAKENAAYLTIAMRLEADGPAILQTLSDAALSLCDAGTSGVSILERQLDGSELFRWTVLSGRLAGHVNGSTPRDFSPCGVCLDRGEPVLLRHPERRFTYFQATGVPFVEGLVLPFEVEGRHEGTLWIVTHDAARRFDSEDVRVMTRLTAFAGLAFSSAARSVRSS